MALHQNTQIPYCLHTMDGGRIALHYYKKKNLNQCQIPKFPPEPAATSSHDGVGTSDSEVSYMFNSIQDWSEIEIGPCTETVMDKLSASSDTAMYETYDGDADHTCACPVHSARVSVEPSDAAVQTGLQANLTSNAGTQTHELDADKKGSFRQSFINKVLRNDESVRRYTGMISKDCLVDLFHMIDNSVTDIFYWKGQKSASEENRIPAKLPNKPTNRALSHFEEYLLTLVFLRKGFDYGTLGELFEISRSLICTITITWINILYTVFKDWLVWPSAAQVRASLPPDYPAQYADTRTILDCTEFFTVKPSNVTAQASTYSNYKHHNTLKVLIGITPTGLISFVSSVYGGNTSDRHIAEAEFIDKVESGDAIMVDRGFNIGDLILQRGAKLHIPPFTRKKMGGKGKGLNKSEIVKTRNIASLRIHVERAIQRMKTYHILGHY